MSAPENEAQDTCTSVDHAKLAALIKAAVADGRLCGASTDDAQRIDWAYGNAKISNEAVTREMVERAAKTARRGTE